MTLPEFLAHLRSLDIHIWAENDHLHYNAPVGALTPELKAELVRRKAEILSHFTELKSHRLSIHPEQHQEVIPASFAQQRLWFIQQYDPQSYVYNVKNTYLLIGPLVLNNLELSLLEIVRRHEILRTRLAEQNGELVQIVSSCLPGQTPEEKTKIIHLIDLSEMPEVRRQNQAEKLLRQLALQPFDLENDALLRVTVIRLAQEEHLLQIVMHHVVTDGWSMRVFNRELSSLYNAFCQDKPSPLPELPVQYADYTVWQRQWLQGEVMQQQSEYWKHQLDGTTGILNLPTDYPRPATQTYNGARIAFELDEQITQQINELRRSENVTLFMILLAALDLLLYHYTGQEDILVGSPIANRRHKEIEDLIGFFVNTLVLRTDLSGKPTFRQLLQRVRQTALDAYDHQDLPFEQLIHELNPRRDTNRSPLFQVMFTLQNIQDDHLDLLGLQTRELFLESETAHFEWTLFIDNRGSKLAGRLAYNSDLFSAASMQFVIKHFKALLTNAISAPDQTIDSFTLYDDAERQQILYDWNTTQREYPRSLCTHQVFEQQVEQNPNSEAVICGDQRLTYRQLNQRANNLAWHLRDSGVCQDTMVGLCIDRSVDMVIGMLAILKAGGAYVPLDPGYPSERLGFMLQDTGVQILVSQQRWLSALPKVILQQGLEIVLLDQSGTDDGPGENLLNLATPDNLAYVMYTSGSTGEPKGICIPHRAINRLVLNTDYVSIGPGDRIAQASNAAFDAATFEIWGALLNGACLVIIDQPTLISPLDFVTALRQQRIDILFLTTALFNQIAALIPDGFSSLRDLLFGGEAVTPYWVRQVLQAGPPRRLLHVYGPTENTTFSTWHLIQGVPENAATIPIGTPIANSTLVILDSKLDLTPVGLPGEIYLGGDGLARGYHAHPELTSEKFVPDPFNPVHSQRLYKTGDQGRFLADGSVEFIGRFDDQVKLRGFRVELGEIEACLINHPAVKQAAVLTIEDQPSSNLPGEKRLVAYIVSHPKSKKISSTELRAFLKARLPAYMIPSAFVFISEIPLTVNGKLDRKRLPLPEMDDGPKRNVSDIPQNALQRQLAYIWETSLGVRNIGIHDNFFDLGGHSLLAARVFSLIEQLLGLHLPLATLFQSPTIADLAKALEQAPDPRGWAILVPIQTRGSKPPFFCVHNFGGEVVNYAALSENLGKDYPFYGLQAQGIDGVQSPHSSLEEMAAIYIKEIRSVQDQGPYYLGGYCFGGVVAYEMACQLHQQGQQVALLALIDSSPPRRHLPPEIRTKSHRMLNFLRNLPIWIYDFLRSGEVGLVIRRKLRLAGKQVAGRLGRQTEITPFDIIGDAIRTESLPHKQLMDIHMRALWNYRTPQYPGRATLFRISRMPLFRAIDYDFGWGPFVTGGVDVQIVPGAHYNILEEPYVRALAQKLAEHLKER